MSSRASLWSQVARGATLSCGVLFGAFPAVPAVGCLGGGLPGDSCATAIPARIGVPEPFDTSRATASGIEVDASMCGGSFHTGIGPDLFCRLDLVVPGALAVTTCDPDGFDTDLALLAGSCEDLVTVACNGDAGSEPACQPRHSRIELDAVSPGSYLIRVGGFDGAVGAGTLLIEFTPECSGDFDGDGRVRGNDLGILFLQWGTCGSCVADLTGDGRVDGADLGLLFLHWGDCT
jgi:hypothetical protein